jgi:hypothetical protein
MIIGTIIIDGTNGRLEFAPSGNVTEWEEEVACRIRDAAKSAIEQLMWEAGNGRMVEKAKPT